MKPRNAILGASFALAVVAAPSQASLFYEFYNITSNSPFNAAAGEAQLRVEVFAVGNQAAFRFTDDGPVHMVIQAVYFDSGPLASLSLIETSPGVQFRNGGSPPVLPGGADISPPFKAVPALTATAVPPPPFGGIGPGQWLQLTYDLQAGLTFGDVEAALANGNLRIGLHVIAFPDGGSESFVNVPAPGAAALLLGAAGFAWRRRRPASL